MFYLFRFSPRYVLKKVHKTKNKCILKLMSVKIYFKLYKSSIIFKISLQTFITNFCVLMNSTKNIQTPKSDVIIVMYFLSFS